MGRRENYERQHKEIREAANTIITESKKKDIDFRNAAASLNKLAGLLSIHLKSEDKFLYPELENSSDEKISKTALTFDNEMREILDVFTKYKNNYNIARKIEDDLEGFKTEGKKIIEALFKRMEREEKELYIYIS
ncbi:MAG: hypothetical protein B6I28_04160 [Fusobacteriia bacterium 4572_132]|nr:MAG: hypothetical protein B6I28_04160 [Fusobacteriia bacterium 4572_132]